MGLMKPKFVKIIKEQHQNKRTVMIETVGGEKHIGVIAEVGKDFVALVKPKKTNTRYWIPMRKISCLAAKN